MVTFFHRFSCWCPSLLLLLLLLLRIKDEWVLTCFKNNRQPATSISIDLNVGLPLLCFDLGFDASVDGDVRLLMLLLVSLFAAALVVVAAAATQGRDDVFFLPFEFMVASGRIRTETRIFGGEIVTSILHAGLTFLNVFNDERKRSVRCFSG